MNWCLVESMSAHIGKFHLEQMTKEGIVIQSAGGKDGLKRRIEAGDGSKSWTYF